MSTQTTSTHPVSGLRRAGLRSGSASPAVAAVILEDGTIRPLARRIRSRMTEGSHGWSNGTLSGDGWMLWWERRALD